LLNKTHLHHLTVSPFSGVVEAVLQFGCYHQIVVELPAAVQVFDDEESRIVVS